MNELKEHFDEYTIVSKVLFSSSNVSLVKIQLESVVDYITVHVLYMHAYAQEGSIGSNFWLLLLNKIYKTCDLQMRLQDD